MADVEQMKKIVPFVTCEVSICQFVCELISGINILDLDLCVQVDSVKQPMKSSSVGSGYMSHCWTSAFDDHFNHGFVILKHVQKSIGRRKNFAFEGTLST